MINLKEELQNYQPINPASLAEGSSGIPDNIRNSIILYNKAIESVGNNSEDIAIIELKKAISMNPEFYEAMNLLGICYSYINEKEKAAEMFEKVIAAENNSVKAMNYLKLMNDGGNNTVNAAKTRKKDTSRISGLIKKGTVRKNTGENQTGSPKKVFTMFDIRKNGVWDILKYFIGFTAGVLLVLVLGLNNLHSGDGKANIPNTNDDEKKLLNEKILLYESRYNELDSNYKALQSDLNTARETADYYKFTIKLYEIEDLIGKKDYENAADMLLLMKSVDFKSPEKEKFESMYKSVMPAAAQKLYEEGLVLVNTKQQYEDALKKLDKIQNYQSDFSRMDAVLYYMGKCYQKLNESRSALAEYQKLINQYPGSSYVKWANIRINELTEIP